MDAQKEQKGTLGSTLVRKEQDSEDTEDPGKRQIGTRSDEGLRVDS